MPPTTEGGFRTAKEEPWKSDRHDNIPSESTPTPVRLLGPFAG